MITTILQKRLVKFGKHNISFGFRFDLIFIISLVKLYLRSLRLATKRGKMEKNWK